MPSAQRSTRNATRQAPWVLAAVLVFAWGCEVPIAQNLADPEANQIVVALAQANIAATKQHDPQSEGQFEVRVPQGDVAMAIRSLHAAGLPAQTRPGVLEALGEGGLVATRTSEQARLVAGIAGDLERSLQALDGVIGARVHLAIPEPDPFQQNPQAAVPTAAVLIRHRGATPPLAASEIQRLVAGSVPQLVAQQVAVVMHPVTAPSLDSAASLASLGPISVTRSSMGVLRWVLFAAAALNVILVALVVLLLARLRRGPTKSAAEAAL